MDAITAKSATILWDARPALSSPNRVKIHSDPVMILERLIQTAKNIMIKI